MEDELESCPLLATFGASRGSSSGRFGGGTVSYIARPSESQKPWFGRHEPNAITILEHHTLLGSSFWRPVRHDTFAAIQERGAGSAPQDDGALPEAANLTLDTIYDGEGTLLSRTLASL